MVRRAEREGSRSPSRRRAFLGHPLTHLFVIVLAVALIQGFLVKVGTVPSGSMEQTLQVGDRILVNRLAAEPTSGDIVVFTPDEPLWPSSTPDDGSVAAIKHGVKWLFGDVLGFGPTTSELMVKRVIAVEGQRVSCCDKAGALTVDGQPLDEPYLYEDPPFEPGTLDCASTPISIRCFAEVEVPAGMLLVLGDHRSRSADSVSACRGAPPAEGEPPACVRWVRTSDVLGEAFAVIWPLNRFGAIDSGRGAP